MGFFDLLQKKQRPTPFPHSEELRFFLENASLLSIYPSFRRMRKAKTPFAIIRANLVIRSIINKKMIEEEVSKVRESVLSGDLAEEKVRIAVAEVLQKAPHYDERGGEIYIPFFERHINAICSKHPEKLLDKRYQNIINHSEIISIDPFDTYGPRVFASGFTGLQLLMDRGDSCAYYDKESYSIFIVNKQGRLDCRIALFDRYLADVNDENIEFRTREALECFYRFDYDNMIKALVENKLISSSLLGDNNLDTAPIILGNRI